MEGFTLPTFTPLHRDTAAVFDRSLPALDLFAAFTGVFILGSFVAFSKYGVR
jgi:hypothetical protein